MDKKKIFYKNVVVQIFRDHWAQFKHYHPELVTDEIEENVEKMMGCGLLANGYFEYICPGCLEKRLVGFTCKSRFCLRCSKVYVEKWIQRMKEIVFKWIKHRHIILTVPGSLREYFRDGRMLKKLANCGVKTIKEVIEICNHGEELEAGYIVVIQTFGRPSTWNPHLHTLVTEGGFNDKGEWKDFYYFEYETLRKKWMYTLLEMVKEELGDKEGVLEKVAEIYRQQGKVGLIVRAKKEKVRKRDIVGYLIKYVASPPIALSRIECYDGERVRYWYKEHPTDKKVVVTVSVYEFIRRMIQHIMPKGLQVIGHYGLYSRRKVSEVREKVADLFEGKTGVVQEFETLVNELEGVKNYRERIKKSFGIDPLSCKRCGIEMILNRIWHPKYGIIYDFWRDGCIEDIGEVVQHGKVEIKEDAREKQLCFAV